MIINTLSNALTISFATVCPIGLWGFKKRTSFSFNCYSSINFQFKIKFEQNNSRNTAILWKQNRNLPNSTSL